jgi:hypothetical protein
MYRFLFLLTLLSCTENESAKFYGGAMSVALPCGEKLFDITWKESSFWYATRPMREDDVVETYVFREKSGYGMVEGSVNIKECRR